MKKNEKNVTVSIFHFEKIMGFSPRKSGKNDTKDMDVAQPKWLPGCPKEDLFKAKNTQNAFCHNIISLFLQAGQVWFPDSAHKTARAITDFNREELPMLIFANWRGFSGKLFIFFFITHAS